MLAETERRPLIQHVNVDIRRDESADHAGMSIWTVQDKRISQLNH